MKWYQIDVTTYTDANDYALYRVPEVWLLKRNRLAIYGLGQSEYQLQATSRYFPDVDLQALVAQCLEAAREHGTGVASESCANVVSPKMPTPFGSDNSYTETFSNPNPSHDYSNNSGFELK